MAVLREDSRQRIQVATVADVAHREEVPETVWPHVVATDAQREAQLLDVAVDVAVAQPTASASREQQRSCRPALTRELLKPKGHFAKIQRERDLPLPVALARDREQQIVEVDPVGLKRQGLRQCARPCPPAH